MLIKNGVHPEKFDPREAFALECAASATCVANIFVTEFIAYPVGNTRRDDTDKIISLPPRPTPNNNTFIGVVFPTGFPGTKLP